jgi:hypothetical protein
MAQERGAARLGISERQHVEAQVERTQRRLCLISEIGEETLIGV